LKGIFRGVVMPEITKSLTINQSDYEKSLNNAMAFAVFSKITKKEAELF
jgi:hypothetical protein